MIYFDNAASTPIYPSVLKVLTESHENDFANPSSAHKLGRELQKRVDKARAYFIDFFEESRLRRKGRFVFTSSATESNNMILSGLPLTRGDVVYVSFADHPSITEPLKMLEGLGIIIKEIPLVAGGEIDQESFLSDLDEKVKLVVLTHVNNTSGNVYPITELSLEIKKKVKNTHIHVDAVQGFAKIPCKYSKGNFDSISISSHKIGGPKGVAGLYFKTSVKFCPLLYGGGQEENMRSSTLASPLIFAFVEATRVAFINLDQAFEQVTQINKKLRVSLEKDINSIIFTCSLESSSPYILTFILPDISSDIILRHMERENIFLSSTSACSSRIKGENRVFKSLKIPFKFHKFVLRVSFSSLNTYEECETFVNVLVDNFVKLKKIKS